MWLDAIEDTLDIFEVRGVDAQLKRAIHRVDRSTPNDELVTLGDCTRVNRDSGSLADPQAIPMQHAFELIQGDVINRRIPNPRLAC